MRLRSIPTPTEHKEQTLFVSWFRVVFRDVRIIAIPNGGHRSKAVAGKLKAEGVSSGVPDLFVPEWGMWIEMKRRVRGTVTPAQKDWHEYLRKIGHIVIVAKGFTEAREKVNGWKELKIW